jgi:hypothetical protein
VGWCILLQAHCRGVRLCLSVWVSVCPILDAQHAPRAQARWTTEAVSSCGAAAASGSLGLARPKTSLCHSRHARNHLQPSLCHLTREGVTQCLGPCLHFPIPPFSSICPSVCPSVPQTIFVTAIGAVPVRLSVRPSVPQSTELVIAFGAGAGTVKRGGRCARRSAFARSGDAW